MKLRDWRKKKKLSQAALAKALEALAHQKNPETAKKLKQNTVGYWERGTLPRSGWLLIIKDFTNGQVTAGDFVVAAQPIGAQEAQIGA